MFDSLLDSWFVRKVSNAAKLVKMLEEKTVKPTKVCLLKVILRSIKHFRRLVKERKIVDFQ